MKRTVLIFGLISGVIMIVMMSATVPFVDRIGFDKGAIVGYTRIVLSFRSAPVVNSSGNLTTI